MRVDNYFEIEHVSTINYAKLFKLLKTIEE